jgi:two-component system sensor histidine kinase YesM
MTTSLGDILHYSLNFTNEMVCLSEEIQYLEGYLIIQNERFDNKINIKIYSDDNAMECLIQNESFSHSVENSLEHGFKGKQGNWQIDLFCKDHV